MPIIEKHGAEWYTDDGDAYQIVFEHYDARTELMAVVEFKSPNLYRAAVHEKRDDPQWRLPGWSERRPEALFDNEAEAVAYVMALLDAAPIPK